MVRQQRRWHVLVIILLGSLLMLPVMTARATPAVDARFFDYYHQHQGIRILGYPLTELVEVNGYAAQYFEKGRIEDHRHEVTDPRWAFMYGRLSAELMERDPQGMVNNTSITYADLAYAHRAELRIPAPTGFRGGTTPSRSGMFVPYDAQLRPASGYIVPLYFWTYINRNDLFPGGWLHDVGLPMTDAFQVETYKNGERRDITMQAFERAVLTYDPRNPREWQVERGNIGADAVRTSPTNGQPIISSIEIPRPNEQVTLPIHLLARLGTPGEQVVATLRWQDGTEVSNTYTLLAGEDGRGLLIDNLDWVNLLQPPQPATQPATITIRNTAGVVLAQQSVVVLSADDPNTQEITLYWTVSGAPTVQPQQRRIVRTERVGTAALEELLWGPPAISQVGYGTALPTPIEVLSYSGRQPDWGPRVRLLRLTIENGIATADFSREIQAYGGGSARVQAIRDQVTQTLLQFPTITEVRIAVDGQTEGVLQP